MRNAAGEEMAVPLKATIAFDDPEAMCQAAVLGLGVTQIVMAHALRHLESGALVRLVPQWYADAGPISIYYASRDTDAGQDPRLRRLRRGGISTPTSSRTICRQHRLTRRRVA